MLTTLSVKLLCPKDEGMRTIDMARKVFDLHARAGFKEGTWSKYDLHDLCYGRARERFPSFNSALVQTTRDVASEALKQSKGRKLPKAHKYQAIRHNKNTVSFKGDMVSICMDGGRKKYQAVVPARFQEVWQTGRFKIAMFLWNGKHFKLNVVFEVPDTKPTEETATLGIDRGMLNVAVCSDGHFFGSKMIRRKQRDMLFLKRSLQERHSRSSQRHLASLRGHEKRFQGDANHCITKRISEKPYGVFVLEELTGIRQRMRKFGRHGRTRAMKWAFHQFDCFLSYKAERLGKKVEHTDARYTSQNCHICGQRGKRNGGKFSCICGLKCHADLNAAKNIRNSHLSRNQSCGQVAYQPANRSTAGSPAFKV